LPFCGCDTSGSGTGGRGCANALPPHNIAVSTTAPQMHPTLFIAAQSSQV